MSMMRKRRMARGLRELDDNSGGKLELHARLSPVS
jgi:hypothetical protein